MQLSCIYSQDMNFKNTPARAAISNFLINSSSPVDVEQIIKFLKTKKFSINKVTVYRNLDTLYKTGVLERLEFGEGKFRYELKKNHHHHLICTNCGKIEDIEGEYLSEFEAKIRQDNGFLVKSHSLEFYGLCSNCQK